MPLRRYVMAKSGRSLLVRQSPDHPNLYQMVDVMDGGVKLSDTALQCKSAEEFISLLAYRVQCADPEYDHVYFCSSVDDVRRGIAW